MPAHYAMGQLLLLTLEKKHVSYHNTLALQVFLLLFEREDSFNQYLF